MDEKFVAGIIVVTVSVLLLGLVAIWWAEDRDREAYERSRGKHRRS